MTGTAAQAAPLVRHPRRMLDRYEILAEIARGGMGTVYLARLGGAGGFERLFAIKLMHDHLAEEDVFVTMMLDEARTAAHIHHPNAVGIIDAREGPVGLYLVMNYVDGFAFSTLLEHPGPDGNGLDARTRMRLSIRVLVDAAHGLHAAHTAKNTKGERLGIVHRDVSPQNVIVGVDGVSRIIDFGIALAASRIASSRPGVLKGKPAYMAPEQARGAVCDPRTDVFALGVVLWESLTGCALFETDTDVGTLLRVIDCVVEPPTIHVPDLPPALVQVAMRALGKTPDERFASAREFATALERAAEASDLCASPQEVEETVATLFAAEIADRQTAIERRMAESSGPERALDRAGLASVSRLVPRARGSSDDSSPEFAPPVDGPAGESSGVRESTPRADVGAPQGVDPHGSTGLHDTGARNAPVQPPGPTTTTRSRAPLVAAIVLGLVGIAGAVAALLATRTPRAVEVAPVAAPPSVPLPPVAVPVPAELPVGRSIPEGAAAPPEVAPVEAAPAEGAAAVNEGAPVAPSAVEPPSSAPEEARTRRPRAPAAQPVTAPPAEAAPERPRQSGNPEVEANPYFTH